jgi:hypothetical protein
VAVSLCTYECRLVGDDCVEVAFAQQAAYVRDSKDVTGAHLAIGRDEWTRFVRFAAHI